MMQNKLYEFVLAWLNINTVELALMWENNMLATWDLRSAARELERIKNIIDTTKWPAELSLQVRRLVECLEETIYTVRNRDSTRVKAAHTRLLASVQSLRELIREHVVSSTMGT
jgi:RPA family protein